MHVIGHGTRSALLTLVLTSCATAPAPATPAPEPAPAPPDDNVNPTPEPEPTLTGVKPPTDSDDDGEPCSVWSGGPRGDAKPPEGYVSNECPAGTQCVCNAQAGYSCSGTCR